MTYALVVRGRDREEHVTDGILLALTALVPSLFLTLAFPEGGYAAFPLSVYAPIPVVADPRGLPAVEPRADARRWARSCTRPAPRSRWWSRTRWAATRAGSARCSPGRCCCVRPRLTGASSPRALLVWASWRWPGGSGRARLRDIVKYVEDPGAKKGYFEPLKQFLATLPDQRRIEIPFTRSHWEAADIAGDSQLARGSLRQLDRGHEPDLLPRPAHRADLRQLADRERRALRGAAQRAARQPLLQPSAR